MEFSFYVFFLFDFLFGIKSNDNGKKVCQNLLSAISMPQYPDCSSISFNRRIDMFNSLFLLPNKIKTQKCPAFNQPLLNPCWPAKNSIGWRFDAKLQPGWVNY